jgi:mannose-6-phosphate isomerase-like protein (cupin superfamily)
LNAKGKNMSIVNNDELESLELPGLRHQTIGGHKQGVKTMEIWLQTMAPGAATPVHCHACEEVILILTGSGECTVGGKSFIFGPNSTLILEPDVVHQIVNTSDEEMKLVAALGMAPVRVETADGAALPLPWDAPSE